MKGWEQNLTDLYINYTIVIGLEFSSTAPKIIGNDHLDNSNRGTFDTNSIVYRLMSGFEAIYKCDWFEAYVFEIETIRLSNIFLYYIFYMIVFF